MYKNKMYLYIYIYIYCIGFKKAASSAYNKWGYNNPFDAYKQIKKSKKNSPISKISKKIPVK